MAVGAGLSIGDDDTCGDATADPVEGVELVSG
jgi:hypothetical protein